jgi:predicted dehydrogenase
MEQQGMTRRDFLGKSAAAAAVVGLGASALGQGAWAQEGGDRVRAGWLGSGIRGFHLLNIATDLPQVEVVAVADIFDGWRNRALGRIEEKGGKATGYPDLEAMLEEADIDCVVAATPEHVHVKHILQALDADKDIYIEKPMTHTWEEGMEVVRANEEKKKVIQVGTQRRSVDIYYKARDIVQSGGIGEITQCKGWWHRNSNSSNPQWRYPIPEDASEETIDWDKFLYNAPYVPFDVHRYFQWRCYWDYSNGPAGDLMVHQLDAINLVMGGEMPKSAMGMGDIYRFHELGRTTPDTWNAIVEYPGRDWAPSGYMVQYSCVFSNEYEGYGEIFYGTNGTIVMNDREMKVVPEREQVADEVIEAMEMTSETWGDKEHLINFFECVQSRDEPNCTEHHGHYAASAAHMAVMSHHRGKQVKWDDIRLGAYTS